MTHDKSIPLAFGDVKVGGKITVRTHIGDTVAVLKIAPVLTEHVNHAGQYKLSQGYELSQGGECPEVYNCMHKGGDGRMNYFFLSDEVTVMFFPDF